MSSLDRPDDFETRRAHLRGLSDEDLHARFWELAHKLVEPLIAEARTHTTPAIERSVLLRMGFSGAEARALTEGMADRGLLGHGAGRLVAELAKARGISVREAGEALMAGRHWEDLGR
jgi:D-ornithine 4,5-aminomutase subunit alpha